MAARQRAVRGRLLARTTIIDVVRAVNASTEPVHVAEWLVREMDGWFPAPCWAVIAPDVNGQPAVLAEHGLAPALGPALWAVTTWVLAQGTCAFVADLAQHSRSLPDVHGSAMAFPLVCRRRTVGAVVGLNPAPSRKAPALAPGLLAALQALLEPAAVALDNALALQKAEALSVTDDLTRLYNSRYLHTVLRREAKRAVRTGRPLSLLFVDLDGFKQVNDGHGHLMGSKALVQAAATIRGCARETDVVARFGGDEFSVVLPDTGREGAMAVAVRVRDRLRACHFLESDGLTLRLTASTGVATLPDVTRSAEDLLRAADAAMYRAKAAGKDGIHVAQE